MTKREANKQFVLLSAACLGILSFVSCGITQTGVSVQAADSLSVSWEQVGMGGGGRYQSIDFSPRPNSNGFYTVYIGGDTCGLYKSEDNGESWIPINTGLYDFRTSKVAVCPDDPSVLYVATSGGLFKSVNGGASWSPVNFGRSFSTSKRNNALAFVSLNPSDPSMVYIGTGDYREKTPLWDNATEIYLSPDGGLTWERVYKTTGYLVYSIAANPNKPNSIYAALGRLGYGGRLLHSSKHGITGTWEVVDSEHGYYGLGFDSANHLFAAGTAGESDVPYVVRFDDSSWPPKKIDITPPIVMGKPKSTQRLAVTPNGVVYIGDRKAWNPAVWRYENGTWSAMLQYDTDEPGWADVTEWGNPRSEAQCVGVAPDGTPWHGGSMQLYRWESSEWRQKYSRRVSPTTFRTRGNSSTVIFARDMIFISPSMYYWGPGDIYIEGTDTGGNDFVRVKWPDPEGGMNDTRVLTADSQNPYIWYVSTHLQDEKKNHAILLKKETDGTWHTILTSCRPGYSCPFEAPTIPDGGGIMDVIASGNTILVSTYYDGVYRSTDGGASWGKVSSLGTNVVDKFSRSALDPSRLMAAVSSGSKGIWRSTDNGATWTQVRYAPHAQYAVAWAGAGTWYASEWYKILRTQNDGATWETVYEWESRPDIFANMNPPSYDISVGIVDRNNPAANPVAAAFTFMGYFDHSCMGGVACSLDGGVAGTWIQLEMNGVTYHGWGVEFNPFDPFELFYLTYGSGPYKTKLTGAVLRQNLADIIQ